MKNRNIEKDLTKLAHAFFEHVEYQDYDPPYVGLDMKRPFGDGNIYESILNIIGVGHDPENIDADMINYADNLYRALAIFLKRKYP